ncbi:MAG TPA: hypothetical protein VF096_02605 [Azonexus sp.]
MPRFTYTDDTFGDRFDLENLPLPRPAGGYAVQQLGSDQLLDRVCGEFLPVRSPLLSGLFDSFDAARAAAESWVDRHCSDPGLHRLAIVPAAYDEILERHVLIYGVLEEQP